MTRNLDLTKPETLKRLAALPYYGQAISLLRPTFPEWGLDPNVDHDFTVMMESEQECGCNCPHCISFETKTEKVEIEARTTEEAIAAATALHPEWEVVGCNLTHGVNLDVPDWVFEEPIQ